LRDKKTGKILNENSVKNKLVELEKFAVDSEERTKLERNLRGIINRLNEQTLLVALRNISEAFAVNGHNDVKQILFEMIYKSIVVAYRLPDRIIIEYAVLLALIHTKVSADITSHFIEKFILEYLNVVDSPPEGKCMENLSILLAHLYNFRNELAMSVSDIINAAEHGRWWLVGSAWVPSGDSTVAAVEDSGLNFAEPIIDLAKRSRMSTSTRKKIFCTLVSSRDEVDAFEKLMRLSLKGHQEREIIYINIHCVLLEPSYNPFYAAVIEQFCCFHKRFKLTLQYAIWDRIKELSSMEMWQRTNLALLIGECIMKRSVGITVLKVGCKYLTEIRHILANSSEDSVADLFKIIVKSSDQRLFIQGLQIFIQMMLQTNESDDGSKFYSKLKFLSSILDDDSNY
uniref:MI domain-containing protein n=1 Tax=Dracunculus medinensis TaxID=318479 RepID=A0A0N4UHV0_DRAME